jgi:hypothetical protein
MTQSEIQMMFDQLHKLTKQVELLGKSVNNVTDKYSSEVTKDLDAALCLAQGDYPVIGAKEINPYFKSRYSKWHHILVPLRPIFKRNGLSFVQQVRTSEDGAKTLHSILKHSSGQWIESRNRLIPLKNDPQSYGSMLSSMKRYDGMALLGITVSDDPDDDDGEAAMIGSKDMVASAPSKHQQKNTPPLFEDVVGKDQLEQLQNELIDFPEIAERVMNAYNISSLADFPKKDFIKGLKKIQEIKRLEGADK